MRWKSRLKIAPMLLLLLPIVFFGPAGCDGDLRNPMAEVTGNWVGQGSGEEVRFRHRFGMLTLTVSHETEFFFHIDEEGRVEGEGTILYDLITDPKGLDRLVDSVKRTILDPPFSMPKPPAPLDEVTKLQYEAPRMKYGTELRHFQFRGHVAVGDAGKPIALKLQQHSGYRRPDRKKKDSDEFGVADDQQLVVTWEVNGVREESSFPCWSPFLENGAELSRGPGGVWVAEFIESGEHREGKSMWHEYGYVWMARRLAAE